MATTPEKYLRIQNMCFILPDEFSGTAKDAISECFQCTLNTDLDDGSDTEDRVCGVATIYERSPSGNYEVIDICQY